MESPERELYRMACKHYSELSWHCYKQSGEIGRRMEFVNGKFMWVASGFIDICCTPESMVSGIVSGTPRITKQSTKNKE